MPIILYAVIFWVVVGTACSFFSLSMLDHSISMDENVKQDNSKKIYKLKRTKYLFIYHDRIHGRIPKMVFWFHIVYYAVVIIMILFSIVYIITQASVFQTLAIVFMGVVAAHALITFLLRIYLEKIGKTGRYIKLREIASNSNSPSQPVTQDIQDDKKQI